MRLNMRNVSILLIVVALAVFAYAEPDTLTRKSVLPDSVQKKSIKTGK